MTNAAPATYFWTSFSAANTFQDCEEKYFLQYVRKLRPKESFVPFELGDMAHKYLELYWAALRNGASPEDAHVSAEFEASAYFIPRTKALSETAFQLGNEPLAIQLSEMPGRAGRIVRRFYEVRGKTDGERYKPLLIEQPLNVVIAPGIMSNGKIDLVTQDQVDGVVHLWENKTARTVPSDDFRMRDFQTVLYDVKLAAAQFDKHIDHIMWNYIRTKEPEVPEIVWAGTRREGLSRRKDMDTTWEVYAAEIKKHGYKIGDYDDMKEALSEAREETLFFPRFDIPIVVNKELLMAQYVEVSKRMRQRRQEWASELSVPLMHLSWDCDRCPMLRLCNAKLVGGDADDLIPMYYTIGKGGF